MAAHNVPRRGMLRLGVVLVALSLFSGTTPASSDTGLGSQAPSSLTGVAWRLVEYRDGQGNVVPALPEPQVTATFSDDGNISGNSGCNSYRGAYTISGSSIAFGQIMSTLRACVAEPANAQERAFLTALNASTTFELVGDRLTLRDAAGATQLLLVRPTP